MGQAAAGRKAGRLLPSWSLFFLWGPGHSEPPCAPPQVRGSEVDAAGRRKLQRHVLICMRKGESRGSAGGPGADDGSPARRPSPAAAAPSPRNRGSSARGCPALISMTKRVFTCGRSTGGRAFVPGSDYRGSCSQRLRTFRRRTCGPSGAGGVGAGPRGAALGSVRAGRPEGFPEAAEPSGVQVGARERRARGGGGLRCRSGRGTRDRSGRPART